MPFNFDLTASPDENIERFFSYLASSNKEFAAVLTKELPKIVPLPDNQNQRQASRQAFSEAVEKILDVQTVSAIK